MAAPGAACSRWRCYPLVCSAAVPHCRHWSRSAPGGAAILNLYTIAMVISVLILLLVYGWLAFNVLRYRARAGAGEPRQVHGNTRLEIAWTAAPALVLAVIFVLMLRTMQAVEASPPDALRVRVIAHQWWWAYEYPDLGVQTANELHVPARPTDPPGVRVGGRGAQLLGAAARLEDGVRSRQGEPVPD